MFNNLPSFSQYILNKYNYQAKDLSNHQRSFTLVLLWKHPEVNNTILETLTTIIVINGIWVVHNILKSYNTRKIQIKVGPFIVKCARHEVSNSETFYRTKAAKIPEWNFYRESNVVWVRLHQHNITRVKLTKRI